MHVDDVALGVAVARPFDGTEVPDIVYQWKYGVVATGTFRGEIFTCRDSEFRESMRQSWEQFRDSGQWLISMICDVDDQSMFDSIYEFKAHENIIELRYHGFRSP